MGEGLVGEAAQTSRMIHIEHPGAAHNAVSIEAGFGNIRAAALLFSPVTYREHLLCVMALASTEELAERDRSFIERLSSQLGAALHNIKQLEDMKLLAEQLRVRSEEITLKNMEVVEASRMKSEFLANMSHELRTPLNAIIGFSELLVEGVPQPLHSEQKAYAQDILDAGASLLTLINEILTCSRGEAGELRLHPETVAVASFLQSRLKASSHAALKKSISISASVAPACSEFLAERESLRTIVDNLLSNAIKFTGQRGRIEVGAALIDAAASSDGPCARLIEITVADTGVGIAQEDIKRLFQLFTQGDGNLTRQAGGTGLGLALTRRLVELHGGTLSVESAPGVGSTFRARLRWRTISDVDVEPMSTKC